MFSPVQASITQRVSRVNKYKIVENYEHNINRVARPFEFSVYRRGPLANVRSQEAAIYLERELLISEPVSENTMDIVMGSIFINLINQCQRNFSSQLNTFLGYLLVCHLTMHKVALVARNLIIVNTRRMGYANQVLQGIEQEVNARFPREKMTGEGYFSLFEAANSRVFFEKTKEMLEHKERFFLDCKDKFKMHYERVYNMTPAANRNLFWDDISSYTAECYLKTPIDITYE